MRVGYLWSVDYLGSALVTWGALVTCWLPGERVGYLGSALVTWGARWLPGEQDVPFLVP